MFYAKQFPPRHNFYAFFFVPLTTIVTMILADNIKMVKKLQKIFLLFTMYLHKGLFCVYDYTTHCVCVCVCLYHMKTESHEIIPFPFILNCLFFLVQNENELTYDIAKQNVMRMKVNRSEIECMVKMS